MRGKARMPKRQSRHAVIRNLTAIRVLRGIHRADLAEEVGYHVQILGRYERGEVTPSLQRLTDWCQALGYELDIIPVATKTGSATFNGRAVHITRVV